MSTYRICIARSVAVIPFQCRRSAIRWLVCAINTTNLSNVYSMLRFRHHEFRCSYLLSVVSPHTHTPHTHAIKSFEYFIIFEWWRRPFRNAVRCSCWKTKVYKSSIPSEQVCNGAGCIPYTYVLCNDSSWLVRKARLPPMGPAQTEILGPTTFFFDRSLSLAASS